MTHDDADARKLVDFCSRLPEISGTPAQAQADTRWVLGQFRQRRDRLNHTLGSSAAEHERPALRCELDALDAASSVLQQMWQRRFGAPLGG